MRAIATNTTNNELNEAMAAVEVATMQFNVADADFISAAVHKLNAAEQQLAAIVKSSASRVNYNRDERALRVADVGYGEFFRGR